MITLKQVAAIRAGYPFRGSIPNIPEGDAYAVQIRDIRADASVAWDALVRTALEGRRTPDWLEQGDVLFVSRGGRLVAVCLDQVPVPAVCSQYFYLIRVRRPDLLPEFLAWQMNRGHAQRYLAKGAEGTDQPSIRRAILEDLPVAVPPLPVQRALAALQRDAHAERAALEALIENRNQQIEALALGLFDANTQTEDSK